MKIKSITYTQRFNMGNYEHIEISAVAEIEDQDKADFAMASLKEYVQKGLTAKVQEKEVDNGKANAECNESSINDGGNSQEVQAKEESTSDKKTKKVVKKGNKVAVVETPVVETPVVEEVKEEPKAKNVVAYNSSVAEHKSILGGYLVKKYDNAWKTVAPAEEIKAFTASLNGKPFIDDQGNIVPSFLDLVHGFFGA